MSISNGDPYFLVATKQLGFYGQDDWKVNNRLTVNLGLRWDRDFNWFGQSDIPKSRTYQSLLAIASINPIAAYNTRHMRHDDTKDFSPRIGFAYDLTGAGKHVVRGGFGLYFGNYLPERSVVHGATCQPNHLPDRTEPVEPGRHAALRRDTWIVLLLAGEHRRSRGVSARSIIVCCGWKRWPTHRPELPEPGVRGIQRRLFLGTQQQLRLRSGISLTFSVCMRTKRSTSTRKSSTDTDPTDATGTACTSPGLPVGCNMNFGNVNLIRPLSADFSCWSAGAGQFAQ